MEEKRCSGFRRAPHVVPVSEFYRNTARSDGLSGMCVACHRAATELRVRAKRAAAIAKLGGRCSAPTCSVPGGMTDPRALQFDHVDGGGRARQRAGENGYRIVQAILAGSTDFQVLCANCNWIKKHEQGETVGIRDYGRVPPTERAIPDPAVIAEANARRAAALREHWTAASEEQRASRSVAYSETRRLAREAQVAAEAGLPTDESWTRRDLDGCSDCGTRVRPHRGKGMCGNCYMRGYMAERRKSS